MSAENEFSQILKEIGLSGEDISNLEPNENYITAVLKGEFDILGGYTEARKLLQEKELDKRELRTIRDAFYMFLKYVHVGLPPSALGFSDMGAGFIYFGINEIPDTARKYIEKPSDEMLEEYGKKLKAKIREVLEVLLDNYEKICPGRCSFLPSEESLRKLLENVDRYIEAGRFYREKILKDEQALKELTSPA